MHIGFSRKTLARSLLSCTMIILFPCMMVFGLGQTHDGVEKAAIKEIETSVSYPLATAETEQFFPEISTTALAESETDNPRERAELMAKMRHLDDYGKERQINPDYRKKGYVYTEEMYLKLTGKSELPENWLEEMNPLMGEVIKEEQGFTETFETDDGVTEDQWAPANELDLSLYTTAVSSTEPLPMAETAVCFSMTRLGYPYSQPRRDTGIAYDCSSLVYWSYREAGINIDPVNCHTAANIAEYLEENGCGVNGGDLRPGDLIFYSYKRNGRYKNISHVAMVIDGGLQIHASSSLGKVVTCGIDLNRAVAIARPVKGEESSTSEDCTIANGQEPDAPNEMLQNIQNEYENGSLESKSESQEATAPNITIKLESQEEGYGPGFDDPVSETEEYGPGNPPQETKNSEIIVSDDIQPQ